ncbi:FtsZ/tubulin family protein [Rufibacter tibetensis]|uniref:hypothetical protein n=1 Tax=Rufibacter tibetensis TaxID=512763 RepID=UPI0007833C6C|nr:hypothetical protein [Rufibacter tibetensis]
MIPFKKPIIRLIEVGDVFAHTAADVYRKPFGNDEPSFLGSDSASVVENTPLGIPILRVAPGLKARDTTNQSSESVNPKVVPEVQAFLGENTDIVFVVSTMKDSNAVLAAPLIARQAKDRGVLTISVVLLSPSLEDGASAFATDKNLLEIKRCSDAILVLSSGDSLETPGYNKGGFQQAVGCIVTLVKTIVNILEIGSEINVDLFDVRTVLEDAGITLMGTSRSSGPGRASRVIKEAMEFHCHHSKKVFGAKWVLLSVVSGEQTELEMEELTEITDFIQRKAGEEAEVIFGLGNDPALEDNIQVTLIASGFPDR